jgi:hypothetical protein
MLRETAVSIPQQEQLVELLTLRPIEVVIPSPDGQFNILDQSPVDFSFCFVG